MLFYSNHYLAKKLFYSTAPPLLESRCFVQASDKNAYRTHKAEAKDPIVLFLRLPAILTVTGVSSAPYFLVKTLFFRAFVDP